MGPIISLDTKSKIEIFVIPIFDYWQCCLKTFLLNIKNWVNNDVTVIIKK